MRRGLVLLLCLPLLLPSRGAAQGDSLTVKAAWSADQFRGGNDLIELTLGRALRPGESIGLVLGTTDVSAMADVQGTRVRYRPHASVWSAQESAVVVYLVRDTSWTELASLPIKVRNRFGLDEGRLQPTADLSSAGQLREGGTQPPRSERTTYQDLTLRLGVGSTLRRAPWVVEWGANGVGSSRTEQRLQYGERGDDALPVDLTDYNFRAGREGFSVTAGMVRRSDHRQLLGGFSSRGVGSSMKLGLAEFDAAVMNATNVIGFGNFLGLEESAHRISAGRLGLELYPSRPGAMHLTVSGVTGSVLPRQNVNQSSVTDAERSRGWGVQLDAAAPDDRIALSGGVAQSRFTNPVDPLLAGDSTLVAVREETRMARFGELRIQLLRDFRVTDSLGAALSLNARHERVDPMYRSIGSSPQADTESHGVDLTGTLGALNLAGQFGRARDNLANVATILTSRTNTSALTAALPLASFGRPDQWFLPVASYGRQATHQFGDGVPDGGNYSVTDIPDQVSVSHSASLEWTRNNTTFAYRWNRSDQDNRQPGMESADITGTVQALALGLAPRTGLTVAVDVSRERQQFADSDMRQGLDRVGVNARWQLNAKTDVSGNVARATTEATPDDPSRVNTELLVEASRAFSFYKLKGGQPQSRVFVRFSRALQSQGAAGGGSIGSRMVRWTLNAGGSARLF